MASIKGLLPHLLTLSNLFMGFLAILQLLHGRYLTACGLVLGAMLADFADGAVARALGVSGPLGKQLDSLADAISFGLVPAFALYCLLSPGQGGPAFYAPAVPAGLIAVFSVVRLGKFNLDKRQTSSFIGLATPAMTIFVLGLLLIEIYNPFGLAPLMHHQAFLYTVIALLSYLLIAEIPMFSLKGIPATTRERGILLTFVLLLIVFLLIAPALTPSVLIAAYILGNAGHYLITGKSLIQ